jgi:Flp pilus assembly pilin Flp
LRILLAANKLYTAAERTAEALPISRPWGTDRVKELLRRLIHDNAGQDIAEYAVMLAVILIIVVGTVKLIGSNANNTFSNVASSLQ